MIGESSANPQTSSEGQCGVLPACPRDSSAWVGAPDECQAHSLCFEWEVPVLTTPWGCTALTQELPSGGRQLALSPRAEPRISSSSGIALCQPSAVWVSPPVLDSVLGSLSCYWSLWSSRCHLQISPSIVLTVALARSMSPSCGHEPLVQGNCHCRFLLCVRF